MPEGKLELFPSSLSFFTSRLSISQDVLHARTITMAEANPPTPNNKTPDEEFPELDSKSLLAIISENDINLLNQYITSFAPGDILGRRDPYHIDPFYLAAKEAQPETLRILLELYATTTSEPFDQNRGFSLLHAACEYGNLENVRFILKSQESGQNRLPLGIVDLHGVSPLSGYTPILAAASSLRYLMQDAEERLDDGGDLHAWIDGRIERGKQLIHFLLDRGCSATDTAVAIGSAPGGRNQPRESVLRTSVSRASRAMIQRLIENGADIYLKHEHCSDMSEIACFGDGGRAVPGSTTLHLASQFFNADVVDFLLDYHRNNSNNGPDLALARDSYGRLPLHYAAAGPGRTECRMRDEDLSVRIPETIQLLVSSYPAGINHIDDNGYTPLHYAAAAHAACCGSTHASATIQSLLSHGADPKIPSSEGKTALHILGYNTLHNTPISTKILDALLAHGIDLIAATQTGHTALHIFAQNLHQISTAMFLVQHGTDICATTVKGDTVFHCMARGFLNPWDLPGGGYEAPTNEYRIRAQDTMMKVLVEGAGGDSMMSQRNLEGKTAYEVMAETRKRWRESELWKTSGRGRGRPL